MTGSQTYCRAFVGGDDVMRLIEMVRDVGTHVFQQAVRDTCKEINVVCFQLFYKEFWADHCLVPGMRVSISLMGMQ